MRCPACGFAGEDALFRRGCPSCGYSAPPPARAPNRPGTRAGSARQSDAPLWLYAVAAVTFLAALAGLIAAMLTP
ncbi:MAG: hypothetical protein LBR16_06300 [Treponema sp.]|nr:hypothetical protein [Treponema sp.]